jgi:predicted DsbA family dithiol-disulfide isomerase
VRIGVTVGIGPAWNSAPSPSVVHNMLVEIWSDVVCPWCYIGKRRFEAALARFEHADEVEVRWRSFELDPRAPLRRSGNTADHLAGKYGMSVEDARARLTSMDQLAAAEGLQFDLAETKGGNTFAAHRLIHLAGEHGLGDAAKEALLHAYFIDGAAVSEPDVLYEVGVRVGLDATEVASLLEGDRFSDAVRAEEAEAAELGATGVPFFVFDRSFAVPGAQESEVFLQTMRRAWSRAHPPVVVTAGGGAGGACGGEGDACTV